MRRTKKGSLELSMNSIVILILAIVLLSLGLTFMKGLFTKMTGKVNVAVDTTTLTNPPKEDDPLTLTPKTIDMKIGETQQIDVAFMNVDPNQRDCTLSVKDTAGTDCPTGTQCPSSGTTGPIIVFQSQKLTMVQNQVNLWTMGIDAKSAGTTSSVAAGSYILTVVMTCPPTEGSANTLTYQKDLVLSLRQ